MKLTLDTWIVSDTHFGHDNIVRYCNRPTDHNELMVKNWNAVVRPDEDILHLGDLLFKKNSAIDCVNQLVGRKYLLKGNHDRQRDVFYDELGFKIAPRRIWFNDKGRQVLLTHRPEVEVADWHVNIHGHIHNNGYGGEEIIDPKRDYRNVSVEVMNYTPVRLRDILYGDKYEPISEALIDEWMPR